MRPRRTFPARNSAAEPCPVTALQSPAQLLVPVLRQNGRALRAESLRGIPDTLPLTLQGSGSVRQGRTRRIRAARPVRVAVLLGRTWEWWCCSAALEGAARG